MLRIAATAIALAFAVATPASADMTLKQFRNYAAMLGRGSLVRSYLAGLRDGIMMLQDVLQSQGKAAPTFCPRGDELNKGTRFEDVIMEAITDPPRNQPWPADIQMSRLVTLILQAEFPCRTY